MPIRNRLTEILGIEHPILLAPMDLVSGGRLAAAVSHAGGLGLLGGGYRKNPSGQGVVRCLVAAMEMVAGLKRNGLAQVMRGSDAGSSPGVSRSILNCWIAHLVTNLPPSCCRLATLAHSQLQYTTQERS